MVVPLNLTTTMPSAMREDNLSLLEIQLPVAEVLNTPLLFQHGEFQNHPANKKREYIIYACNINDFTRKSF